ncbi:ABC transporter ATP-binding protein [Candidatus Woesearchaeota archaeon]|nr:ABC transporter ATP-binding protein [Candidatus Woesearchaeota archaeon]
MPKRKRGKSMAKASVKNKVISKKKSIFKDSAKNKNNQYIIDCKGISKQYGKNKVLSNLDLAVKTGEVMGIIGMSGSGKSTLLNVLIGFLSPETGEVLFRTDKGMMPISKSSKIIKTLIGFAPQDSSFYPKLTAQENLEYFGTLYSLSSEEIAKTSKELLGLVNLIKFKDSLAMELSFGMQKRLGIACALIHKPKVLILDEPTADLDPIMRRETWELLAKVNNAGTTIIIASHLLDELESECDTIAVLHDGKFSQIGSIEKLKQLYTTNNEVYLTTTSKNYSKLIPKLKSKKSFKVSNIVKIENSLIFHTPNTEQVLDYLIKMVKLSKDHIVKLTVSRPSLEEVFINSQKR